MSCWSALDDDATAHVQAGAFVGWFGLVPSGGAVYDVGYRRRREWWGQELATEGTGALIDAAFERLGARTVIAETMFVNERSRRVMERCGLRCARTFHLDWDGPIPGTELGEVEYETGRHSSHLIKVDLSA